MLARQIKQGDECRNADGTKLYWRATTDARVVPGQFGGAASVRCHVVYSDGGHGIRTWDVEGHIPDSNLWRNGANISGTRKLPS